MGASAAIRLIFLLVFHVSRVIFSMDLCAESLQSQGVHGAESKMVLKYAKLAYKDLLVPVVMFALVSYHPTD